VFAILTLYPQPTHLEYLPHPRGLAQAQHHPSIHPSTLFSTSPNLPIPILILNIPNLTHSLACFITPPPPPPNLPPPDPNSSSIPKQKKKKKSPATNELHHRRSSIGFFFFFLRIRRRARFSPFAALLSQSIYPYFTLTVPDFRISKIEGPPSANFALQSTNSLEKPNHHPTDL